MIPVAAKGRPWEPGVYPTGRKAALSPAVPVLRGCSVLVSALPPEVHSLLRTGALPHNLAVQVVTGGLVSNSSLQY